MRVIRNLTAAGLLREAEQCAALTLDLSELSGGYWEALVPRGDIVGNLAAVARRRTVSDADGDQNYGITETAGSEAVARAATVVAQALARLAPAHTLLVHGNGPPD
jgi:hypothetical protein